MKCAVIGLGEFGRAAAEGLAKNGVEVIAVDMKMDLVNDVKDSVALAVCMDGSHEDALKAHGIAEVDVLIAAIGGNFEAQVLLVVHAKSLGIKKIVARATTPDHHRVLKAVGADHVLNPEEEAARWMVQRLLVRDISNYFELAEGFSIVEVKAPAGVVGKTLEDLQLRRRFRLNLIAIRGADSGDGADASAKFNPVPSPSDVIQQNDTLALVGSVIDLANFMGAYGSEL